METVHTVLYVEKGIPAADLSITNTLLGTGAVLGYYCWVQSIGGRVLFFFFLLRRCSEFHPKGRIRRKKKSWLHSGRISAQKVGLI